MNTLSLLLGVPGVLLLWMWLYERHEKDQGRRPVRIRRSSPQAEPALSLAEVRFRAAMRR